MLALLLATTPALAATYNVDVCARYDVNLVDADVSVGDDHFTSDTTHPAWGALVVVVEVGGPGVYADYAEDAGSSAGCIPTLALDSTKTYSIKVHSRASIAGNTVYVWTDTTETTLSQFGPSLWQPTSSGTKTVTSPVADTWNIAAAAGFAQVRDTGGLTGQQYDFVQDAGSTSWDRTNDRVLIGSMGGERKYMIDHEFGHMLVARAMGGGDAHSYDSADDDNCDSPGTSDQHALLEREYQSAAAWEGFAHYYGIITFNNVTGSDCWFMYWKPADWNGDHDVDDANEAASGASWPIASCAAAMSPPDVGDWLGDYCTGTVANRGTEFDWLRF